MTSTEGCDEFSPRGRTTAIVWTATRVRRLSLRPERFLPVEERRGDWSSLPPREAADEAERILAGGGGARRGSVLLTSGAALWVAGRATTFRDGVERAREVLDDGRAEGLLSELRALARQDPATPEA